MPGLNSSEHVSLHTLILFTVTDATLSAMPGLIKMKDFTAQLTLSPRAEWSFRLVANSWLLVPDGEISVMLKSPLWRCCNVMLSCTCSSFLISEAVLEHADVLADRIRLPEARINLLDYNVIVKSNKILLLTRIWNRWGSEVLKKVLCWVIEVVETNIWFYLVRGLTLETSALESLYDGQAVPYKLRW